MQYILLFLEGVITFISPCLLPMLPIYVSYFAGGSGRTRALKNALGFVLGFTLFFITLGAFSGSVGRALQRYSTVLNIVTGLIVVIFGLNFMGVLNISFLNRSTQFNVKVKDLGFWSSILFGMVFSISWTPCISAFLGSALLMASQQASVIQGILLLLAFSLGLGVPFLLSAVIIEKLKAAFEFIKKNYKVINLIAGGLLVIVGVLMMTGTFGYFLSLLTF